MNQPSRRRSTAASSSPPAPPASRCFVAAAGTARPCSKKSRPEASGIPWVHDNAMSPEHYLPETMGPGCAFLDYDNDGWMDIYLVNSGPCDFYKPAKPLRNALYKNNRDGTFTDVTEKAGVRRRHLRHGRGGRRLRQRRLARHLRHRLRQVHSLPQQRRRHLHRRHREGRPRRQVFAGTGPPAPSGSTTTTTAGSICSSAASWITAPTATSPAATTSWASTSTASRASSSPPPACCIHNNGDGTFTEVGRGTDIEKSLGKGLGVVATDINNDGRMDLFVANDTVQNFLFVNRGPDANGDQVGRDRAAGRGGLQRRRPAALRHGRGCRRFRRRRLAGSLRRQRRSGNVLALPEQARTRPSATSRITNRRGAGHAPAERLGTEVLRLRQRRLDRPDPGQRPSRRHDRQLLARR